MTILFAGVCVSPGVSEPSREPSAVQENSSQPVRIVLDPQQGGRVYEGIGYVSSSSSSKLLMDYPAREQAQILDLLFKPQWGASLDHLKLEIGSDINSSSGTEPSHMRSPEDLDILRGSGLWLAKEGKKRNPHLMLDALRWGTPGWIGDSMENKKKYYLAYLEQARKVWGLEFDYLGPDQNEAAFDPRWVTDFLRPALDQAGFDKVKLVALDSYTGKWTLADDFYQNPRLENAIYALGEHYNLGSTAMAKSSGKPLWHSEARPPMRSAGFNNNNGPLYVAWEMMSSYINGKMTKFEMQPFLESYYDVVVYNTKGALVADKPWSGHYQVSKGVWTTAHFTQFIHPGWLYLDGACGDQGQLTWISLIDPATQDASLILLNRSKEDRFFEVSFEGLPDRPLMVWQTTASEDFKNRGTAERRAGTHIIQVPAESIVSASTTTGQRKADYEAPVDAPLSLPWSPDLKNARIGGQARYFIDEGGAWEVHERDGQRVIRQVIDGSHLPEQWPVISSGDPYTLAGDTTWRDYRVSAEFNMDKMDGEYVWLGGRIVVCPKGAGIPEGYRIELDTEGQWILFNGRERMAEGRVSDFDPAKWHRLWLEFKGSKIRAGVDGPELVSLDDSLGGYASGLIGMGSGFGILDVRNLEVAPLPGGITDTCKRIDSLDFQAIYTGIPWKKTSLDDWSHWSRTIVKFDVKRGENASGTVDFPFSGHTIAVIGSTQTGLVKIKASIDGVPVDPPASKDRIERGTRRVLFRADGLAPGPHTLHLEVEGLTIIDAYEVDSP